MKVLTEVESDFKFIWLKFLDNLFRENADGELALFFPDPFAPLSLTAFNYCLKLLVESGYSDMDSS